MNERLKEDLKKLNLALIARERKSEIKTFDWDQAEKIVEQYNIQDAWAGLAEDWFWTSTQILKNGEWVEDHGCYLSSIWATPVFVSDEIKVDCWKWETKELSEGEKENYV